MSVTSYAPRVGELTVPGKAAAGSLLSRRLREVKEARREVEHWQRELSATQSRRTAAEAQFKASARDAQASARSAEALAQMQAAEHVRDEQATAHAAAEAQLSAAEEWLASTWRRYRELCHQRMLAEGQGHPVPAWVTAEIRDLSGEDERV